jgi:hypothetical protein
LLAVVVYVGMVGVGGGEVVLWVCPVSCMSEIVRVMMVFEQNNLPNTWSTLSRAHNHFSILLGLIMLSTSFLFWSALGLYLEQVLPRAYGKRKGVCFCCTLTSHKKHHTRINMSQEPPPNILDINKDFGTTYMRRDSYESVTAEKAALEFDRAQFM